LLVLAGYLCTVMGMVGIGSLMLLYDVADHADEIPFTALLTLAARRIGGRLGAQE